MVDLFKKWDRDGDGSISKAEFRRAMPMLGLTGHTPQEVDALFATFDPDGSGECQQQPRLSLSLSPSLSLCVCMPAVRSTDVSTAALCSLCR